MADPDDGVKDLHELGQHLLAEVQALRREAELRDRRREAEVRNLRQEVADLRAGVIDAIVAEYVTGRLDERAAQGTREERPAKSQSEARHRKHRAKDRKGLRVIRVGALALPLTAGIEWGRATIAVAAVGAVICVGGAAPPTTPADPDRGVAVAPDPGGLVPRPDSDVKDTPRSPSTPGRSPSRSPAPDASTTPPEQVRGQAEEDTEATPTPPSSSTPSGAASKAPPPSPSDPPGDARSTLPAEDADEPVSCGASIAVDVVNACVERE